MKRPDTYIGSVEAITQPMWVFDQSMDKMVYRCAPFLLFPPRSPLNNLVYSQTTFVPGFYKIFDEILVNAADNKVRLHADVDPSNPLTRSVRRSATLA